MVEKFQGKDVYADDCFLVPIKKKGEQETHDFKLVYIGKHVMDKLGRRIYIGGRSHAKAS